MSSLTVRNIEDDVKQQLRVRGARRGTSMEEEARSILRAVVTANISIEEIKGKTSHQIAEKQESAWDFIQRLREKYGTYDLEMPERTDMAADRSIFDE